MRLAWDKKQSSQGAGQSEVRVLQLSWISARSRHGSSEPYVRQKARAAGLVMPRCNVFAMEAHLQEISRAVDKGAHAAVIMDQAGWHTAKKLRIPDNLTLIPLPPRCPELNPVENIWQFMRDNWLSNRIFTSYENILAHCCYAWNRLVDQPWKIMSIAYRQWAHGC
jgi:transposase